MSLSVSDLTPSDFRDRHPERKAQMLAELMEAAGMGTKVTRESRINSVNDETLVSCSVWFCECDFAAGIDYEATVTFFGCGRPTHLEDCNRMAISSVRKVLDMIDKVSITIIAGG